MFLSVAFQICLTVHKLFSVTIYYNFISSKWRFHNKYKTYTELRRIEFYEERVAARCTKAINIRGKIIF